MICFCIDRHSSCIFAGACYLFYSLLLFLKILYMTVRERMIKTTEMQIVGYLMINGHLKATPNTNSVIKSHNNVLFFMGTHLLIMK